jgi:hypothetical protein
MRSFSKSYVQGEDRGQAALLPAAIEDYVAADALVRDAFMDGLNVSGRGNRSSRIFAQPPRWRTGL